jgi:hypothetical protein
MKTLTVLPVAAAKDVVTNPKVIFCPATFCCSDEAI